MARSLPPSGPTTMRRVDSNRRSLVLEIALPLVLLLAVELALRSYVARTPDMPMPGYFANTITTGKYIAFLRQPWKRNPLDVLFLGLSPMMRLDLRHLNDVLAAEGLTDVHTFNFASPMHPVAYNQVFLDRIVTRVSTPRVIVYGITPIDLLSLRTVERMEPTTRRILAFSLHAGTPASWLRRFLMEHVYLLAYRNAIYQVLTTGARWRHDGWAPLARQVDAFGDIELSNVERPVRHLGPMERKYVKPFQSFETRMKKSPLFDNLTRFSAWCRERDIRLVVLLTPVHPVFLELLPKGREDLERFVTRLRRTAEESGALFFDPANGGVGPPDLFRDSHHHNAAGGRWLTDRIAEFLVRNGLIGGYS